MKNLFNGQSSLSALFVVVLYCMAILGMFQGCASYNKQKQKAERFYDKYPLDLAKKCADQFPSKDSISPGKISVKTDTIYSKIVDSVKCPDVPGQSKPVYVKCPPSRTIRDSIFSTDTLFRENTARVKYLDGTLKISGDSLRLVKSQLKASEKTATTRLWWLIGIGIGAGAYTIFRLKKFIYI